MANNYTQFSAAIYDITPEEKAWIDRAFEEVYLLDDKVIEFDDIERDDNGDVLGDAYCVLRMFADAGDEIDLSDAEHPGFQYSIDGDWLWMYAEEGGDPYRLAIFVQQFLKMFRPNTYFTFSYAYTCDKPRIDEFGGDTIFVSADTIVTGQELFYEWLTEASQGLPRCNEAQGDDE